MLKFTSEVVHQDVCRYSVFRDEDLLKSLDFLSYLAFFVVILYLWVIEVELGNLAWFICSGLGIFFLRLVLRFNTVQAESLMVTRQLGVQLTTRYFSGKENTQFLDVNKIQAVILNEGISMGDILFYMAFVVKGKKKLVVAFEHLRPRLNPLQTIYHGTKAIIEEKEPLGDWKA